MNSKVVAGAVVAVMIMGVFGVLLFMTPLSAPSHSIVGQVQDGMERLGLSLGELEDTNLTVSFVEDDSLLYSFDIELYEPASAGDAYTFNTDYLEFHYLEPHVRIRSINLTLGTGVPYSLNVWGTNLDSEIIYDNGALVDGTLTYQANGTLLVVVTEDIVMSGNLDISGPTNTASIALSALYLDIDLPTGVGGELHLESFGSVPISFVDRVGWTWDGFEAYETAPGTYTVDITAGYCSQVYANLLD